MAVEMLARRSSTESIISATSSRGRSRAWNDDMQKTWQQPVVSTETFEDRFARYSEYFSLTETQLQTVYDDIQSELALGCKEHLVQTRGAEYFMSSFDPKCSLKMLDTCVSRLPTGEEKGSSYALEFSGAGVRALKCRLEGGGRIGTVEHGVNLRDVATEHPKGLLDRKCGAMHLFDTLAEATSDLLEKSGDKDVDVGFSVGFSCDVRHPTSGVVLELSKGFETGRATEDPLEGLDFVTLLDMAYWRNKVPARVAAVSNDAVSSLVSCAYEKPKRLPPCTVSFLIGVGLGAAYIEPKWSQFGYKGCVINTELGAFDKLLPVTDVDLEVDFAENGGRQIFEKMIAGAYLGEICRRLVVKVWRDEAPPLAWSRQALPTTAAALIVADDSAELSLAERVLRGLWEWNTDRATRERLQRLFSLVFERSAGLAAAAIAALARRSGRLQPAMGGVTVAVEGGLHISHAWYSDNVRKYLCMLLGESTAQFIHLYVNNDGAGKGAAVLAVMASSG